MSSKTVYPNNLSQSSESNTKFREFTDLNNVKNSNSTYAISKSSANGIASKSGTHNRPSTITAANFKCNIPAGSKITKITLEYANCYTGNISIAGPSVDLLNVNVAAKKGKALTKTMTKTTVSWTGNFSVSKVNNSSFGVKINYPANTKSDVGKVKVQYIRLIIEYSAPNFTLSSQKVSGTYTNDEFEVKLTCNNKGQTSGGTNVNINLPSGVSFVRKSSGDGSISSNVWNTGIGSKLSASINFIVKVSTDGNHNISFSETASGHTNSINLKTESAPVYVAGDDKIEYSPVDMTKSAPIDRDVINIVKEESYYLVLEYDGASTGEIGQLWFYDNHGHMEGIADFTVKLNGNTITPSIEQSDEYIAIRSSYFTNGKCTLEIIPHEVGFYDILGYFYQGSSALTFIDSTLNIIPLPNELTIPVLSIISLSDEEINRLGDGITYAVQSWLKLVSSEGYVRDWIKNFRIAVFNNEIDSENVDYENLTIPEIFENAAYWCDSLKQVNTFEQVTCDFTYDEDYPVYLLICGDYPEGNPSDNNLLFTSPTISENETSDEQCVFPVPIKNLILEDGSLSELSLDSFQSSNPIVLYNLDNDDVETNEKMGILGVQVNITLDSSNTLMMLVKLINPNGVTRERSIQINNTQEDRIVSLGGLYDLWGFEIEDMKNLDEWKVEIIFTNPWSNTVQSNVTIEHVEVIFNVNQITDSHVKCYVNGKDAGHYGMFLEDVDVPTGLKTKVKYLEIEGTDTNEPYCQNVDKKEITIKFGVHGCTIEETTSMLRMLGRLFTNKRDDMDKPILNKIEFSNYPGEYWNVLMVDPFDTDAESVDYNSTLKLVVPDGTSFSTDQTVTSNVGNVSSIVKVTPNIVLIPEGDDITIRELNSKQTMVINYEDGFVEGDVIEVKCATHELILKRFSTDSQDFEDTDISQAIDWHSDFFSLSGDYNFECENAILQTVSYTERW